MHSDCVVKQGNLPSDCLKNHTDELPQECKSLRKATYECKRGMVSRHSLVTLLQINFHSTSTSWI